MHSILVPTDFSENASLALRYAALIASEFNFQIHVVHVYEPPLFERFLVEEEVKSMSPQVTDDMFYRYIEKTLPQGSERQNVQIKGIVKEGNVSTEIQTYADKIEPLMLILGSQGGGSDQWDKLLVGGTAQKIIRRMQIPVMVVPPEADYKPLKKIAYATDFNPDDMEILDELLSFAAHFNSSVTAVHIKRDQWDWDEDRFQQLQTKFEKQLESGALKFEVVENQNVMEGLDSFIVDNHISLLALLKKYHNLWDRLVDRSMALKIALHASIPTMVFKET